MKLFNVQADWSRIVAGLLIVSMGLFAISCGQEKQEAPAGTNKQVTIAPDNETPVPTTEENAIAAINKALTWLQQQQSEEGAFHQPLGMTALAVAAFLQHPGGKYSAKDPFIQKALDYLVSHQHPDGSIWDESFQPALQNYNTSLSLMALGLVNDPKYAPVIQKGQAYVTGIQVVDKNSIYFGGIGYGSDETTRDLSNLNIALQGLKTSGLAEDDPVWQRAVTFLNHVQNNQEVNKASWAGNDGGFVYMPGTDQSLDKISKAGLDEEGRPRSYASMTYAGLLSFIYANVNRSDDRVEAAVQWIRDHYTLDENYGIGQEGLYYNYHTMAKALSAYGKRTFTDAKGVQHDWYAELVNKLVSVQQPDGYWRNEESRWMELDPVLVTSYAVLALNAGYPR